MMAAARGSSAANRWRSQDFGTIHSDTAEPGGSRERAAAVLVA